MDIFITGVIGFDVMAEEVIRDINSADEPINLHIFSGGGSALDGLAIYDALQASSNKTTASIFGFGASSASIIAMGADEILMGEGAFMMIHEASTFTAGNAQDLEKDAKLLEQFNNQIANIYARKTGLELAFVRDLMAEETWLTAEQAIQDGFADGKIMDLQMVASFNKYNVFQQGKLNKKTGNNMEENKTENTELEIVENAVAEEVETVVSEVAEVAEVVEEIAEVTEVVEETQEEELAETAMVQDNKDEVKKYINSFGKNLGVDWYLEGVAFNDAQDKFINHLQEKNTLLEDKLKSVQTEVKNNVGGEAITASPVAKLTETKKSNPYVTIRQK